MLMSELDDSARAALLERNPALATDDFLNTVIHVDGGSDHLASRGSRVCRSSRYYIAHTPGCSGWVVTDKSKVNFYSDCPHRYYVMDNPGSVVEKRCKKAGCPYLYSRYIKYHKKV